MTSALREQPRSRWNRYVNALLAADGLTVAEHRLALAIMRLLPGWRRDEADLGDRLLRKTSHLDGRSFARARAGLVDKRLLVYTPGSSGRTARRSHYALAYGCDAASVDDESSGQGVPAGARADMPAGARADITAFGRARREDVEEVLQKPYIEVGTAHA